MTFRNIFLSIFFIFCNFAIAQNSDKNSSKQMCHQLMELIKDPAFIGKVAFENGMTSMRFYSVEIPLQKEMLVQYGERHKICESKNK